MTDISTIELTPELIFERISDFGSSPNSTLSHNSSGRTSTGGRFSGSKVPTGRISETLPRRRTFSPTEKKSSKVPSPTKKMDPRYDSGIKLERGYYSLGSGVAKASKAKKAQSNKNSSEYGVAISIKGIQGHPFVILEDKENHRHMVPAPDPSEGSDVSSNTASSLQNGHHVEPDAAPMHKVPSRRPGTMHNDWKPKQNHPDVVKPAKAKTQQASFKPSAERPSTRQIPPEERLVKPSDVKAAQKPAPSSLHMRSPRSRLAHERSQTLPGRREQMTRSRSLSPNRALAATKSSNRARSVSPPRNKNRLRKVDDNNTKPVSNLIGFFESGPKDVPPKPQASNASGKGGFPDRGRGQHIPARLQSPSPVLSPGGNWAARGRKPEKLSSSLQRPRSGSKEIEVTLDSQRTNLTVTTATATSKAGSSPMGRYFALTSPASTTPPSRILSNFSPPSQNTAKPVPRKAADPPSRFSPASTSFGKEPAMQQRRHAEPEQKKLVDLKPVSRQPQQTLTPGTKQPRTTSGVSTEHLVKPSAGSNVFGPPANKGRRSGLTTPRKFKRRTLSQPVVSSNQRKIHNHSPTKKPCDYLNLAVKDPFLVKHRWQTAASKALAQEEEIVPKMRKRDLDSAFNPFQGGRKSPSALMKLVDQLASQQSNKPSSKDASELSSFLDVGDDVFLSKRNDKSNSVSSTDSRSPIEEDLITPRSAKKDFDYDEKDVAPTAESQPTQVSKAKIYGPSHQLLRKTKRKRNAQRISTSNPGSRVVSGSEWSESEYSDAESLGMSLHISDDDDDKERHESRSLPDLSSPVSFTGSHKRSSSIVFGKISSTDITKRKPGDADQVDGPVFADQPYDFTAPSVAELQDHISELRATVKELQATADDNLHNFELLNVLQTKLRDVEREKKKLEREIEEGKRVIEDLEMKLDVARNQIAELRMNERHDRLLKQQQAKELDDLKSQLGEMSDELERAKSSSDLLESKKLNESQLLDELYQLRSDQEDLMTQQEEREEDLMKREDEIVALKQALHEEAAGHDEEVRMMKKMHEDVLCRLRDELDNLRQESVSAVEARPRLEEQVASLKSEVERLQDQRRQERSWKRSSSSSDEGFDSSAASRAREEAYRSKELLLKSQEELRESQALTDQLRNEINSLQKRLSHADTQRQDFDDSDYVNRLSSDLSQVRHEKKSLESNLSSLELQRTTLKGQIKEARNDREEAERQIRSLENESSRSKGRVKELENEIERLKKELARTRRHLEAQVCDLELQMSDSDRRLSAVTVEKSDLEKRLSEFKDVSSSDSLLTALHELEKQKSELELALSEEQKIGLLRDEEIEQLTDELRRLSSTGAANAASETLDQLEEFKRSSAQEVETLRADVEAKAKALREADRTNNRLQEELRRMDLELEEELKERENTMVEQSRVERTLHELEIKISELNREKEDKDREMERIQSMLSIIEDDKLNLEEKLELSEKQHRDTARDLHNMREDMKDKDMELEELKYRVKNSEATASEERSKVTELEHQKYVAQMEVSGLKDALEAKHTEVEDVEEKCRKMAAEVKDGEAKSEETLRKLRDTEKQRRFAAKEAEDLTIALSEKVASLDEAQRKLRRLESQMSEMDEASTLATSFRLELDKSKRNHAQELAQTHQELEEAKRAVASSEKNIKDLEEEIRTWEERYETAAGESLELEKQRRNLSHLASEAQKEAGEKAKALSKAEEKLQRIDDLLQEAEERAESLSDQLRNTERKRKEAELECQDAQARLADKERELKDAEKRIQRFQDETEKSNDVDEEKRQALIDLEDSRREAEEGKARARNQLEELQRRLNDEEEKVDLLQDRLNQSDSALRKELERSQEVEDEKESLRDALDDARGELEDKRKAFDQAQEAIRKIEQKMRQYETSHDQRTSLLEKLTADKEKALEKVNDLQQEVKEKRNEMENVEQLMYGSQQDAEVAQNRCQELEDELLQNNREIDQLRKIVEELRADVAENLQERNKAKDNCDSLKKQVELLQQEMKERSDWSNKKRKELQSEIDSVETDLKSAEDDLSKVQEEKKDLEEKLAALETHGMEQQKDTEQSLRREVQQLRDTLDEKTQQVYSAEDTIYRQKEVIEELTAIQQTTEKASLEQMDAYMAESEKQFEQLKSHLQEKNDLLKAAQHEKEGLQREVDALSNELDNASSETSRTRNAHQEEQKRLEDVEQLLKELRLKLKEEQKENSHLQERLDELNRNESRGSNSDDEEERLTLHDMVEEMSLKVQEAEDDKEESLAKLHILQDQVGQLNNELEMEKSQVDVLQKDTQRQKEEVERLRMKLADKDGGLEQNSEENDLVTSLNDKIVDLEEKLQQEANELKAIDAHHQRTEMKLREVLKQAEIETNKANSEKEMMSVRMKSLKQQLAEAENQLAMSEEDRKHLQEELREQTEINYDLKQTLSALGPGAAASGSLFTSV
ncbi:uncharacterized protein LOC143452557 isoform X2 [Clavelina lepadiformis]|uniref:uncharacterized protein LOC143452557 isoform X2 n=1 Tax=Clavelina lepadiformis TaxID=159417 RepID=UPI0040427B97